MEELREKMTVTAHCTLSIPELFPVIGFRSDQGKFPLQNEDQQDRGRIERLRRAKDTVQTGGYLWPCIHARVANVVAI